MSGVSCAPVALQLSFQDNVAVLLRPVGRGEEVAAGGLRVGAQGDIAAGHKMALTSIPAGSPVLKYGHVIGLARAEILPGDHVHLHNLELPVHRAEAEPAGAAQPWEIWPPERIPMFQGYARPDGCAGTRNYVAVISTVNCSASVCAQVRDHFRRPDLRGDFPNVDGVIALTHKSGCAMEPGEPMELLRRVLAGFALHPNVFGYVVIGLGCETNQLDQFRREYRLGEGQGAGTAAFLNIQAEGGSCKTLSAAVAATTRLLQAANQARRSAVPISKLVLAENCGGSDAYSGITANPALGIASDLLVRCGGTSVLAETPEIYGAEHLLTKRAVSREVARQLLGCISWWEEYARQNHGCIDNNPSPGNKAGGLTNIVEKSLGAVAKGGQAPLMAVYRYAEAVRSSGLCFMDTPGFDPVSMTGLVAGGCNLGVFTTGRGSVYGCKPAPCIKVATNTEVFDRLSDDMDINAGTILDGSQTLEQVGATIFEKIIAVASGERTRSELSGIGDEEFAPWQLGATF